MASCDLVVTIPGTKTGEAASLAKPMLVIVPYNRPEEVPYIFLLDAIGWIPLVGKWIKRTILMQFIRKRLGWVAQPNILAGFEVVPELKGILSPQMVAERVICMLEVADQRSRMCASLKKLYQPFAGASTRLVSTLSPLLAPSTRNNARVSMGCQRNAS